MELKLLATLMIGFGIGLKHAVEPDHVIAVSTIASQSKKLWRSTLFGIYWGIGHTATLFAVGMILIFMKREIPVKWSLSFEFLIGLMLFYLGIKTLFNANNGHGHDHEEPHNPYKSYWKSTSIGFIHGLAGSAALVLLTMNTVDREWEGALYILTFGLGTIVGMLLFTTLIGIPFVLSSRNSRINLLLTRITGGLSIVFGLYYISLFISLY